MDSHVRVLCIAAVLSNWNSASYKQNIMCLKLSCAMHEINVCDIKVQFATIIVYGSC